MSARGRPTNRLVAEWTEEGCTVEFVDLPEGEAMIDTTCGADRETLRNGQCDDDEIAVHLRMHAQGRCPANSDIDAQEYERRVMLLRHTTPELSEHDALVALNYLRSNITATQRAGWSDTIYPLVAILNAAGFVDTPPTEEQKRERLATYGGAGKYPRPDGEVLCTCPKGPRSSNGCPLHGSGL